MRVRGVEAYQHQSGPRAPLPEGNAIRAADQRAAELRLVAEAERAARIAVWSAAMRELDAARRLIARIEADDRLAVLMAHALNREQFAKQAVQNAMAAGVYA